MSRLLAVMTVTGTPSFSTREGRSRCSQCDTRSGSVEMITSVKFARGERVADGDERVAVADLRVDGMARGVLEQRLGELDRRGRLLGVGIPVRARDEQREGALARGRAGADRVQQPRRRRGAMSDHQDVRPAHGTSVRLRRADVTAARRSAQACRSSRAPHRGGAT